MAAVGRLAPTPSGALHLGNVCAFAAAWLSARAAGGRVLLRVEDIDPQRSRAGLAAGQRRDLAWLGLTWDEEVALQSTRDHAAWLAALPAGATYRCGCTRREIRDAGGVYPGTCRDRGLTEGALRLHLPDATVRFVDRKMGTVTARLADHGDPVLIGRDGVVRYTLAVVVDDLTDGVTEVVRGADLLEPTAVQIALWSALGATPPSWLHAPLVLGPDGRKLSKSHRSLELATLHDAGWTPADVWRLVLPWLGIDGVERLSDAIARFDPTAGPRGPITLAIPAGEAPRPGEIGVHTAR